MRGNTASFEFFIFEREGGVMSVIRVREHEVRAPVIMRNDDDDDNGSELEFEDVASLPDESGGAGTSKKNRLQYGTIRRLKRRDASEFVIDEQKVAALGIDLQLVDQGALDEKQYGDARFSAHLDDFNRTVNDLASARSSSMGGAGAGGPNSIRSSSTGNKKTRPQLPVFVIPQDNESTLAVPVRKESAKSFISVPDHQQQQQFSSRSATQTFEVKQEVEFEKILNEAADLKFAIHRAVEEAIESLRCKERELVHAVDKLNTYCKLLEQSGSSRSVKADLIVAQIKALSNEASSSSVAAESVEKLESLQSGFESKIMKEVVSVNLYKAAEEMRAKNPSNPEIRPLLEEAARSGSEQAAMRLYKMTSDMNWLEIAAENGNEKAQEKLGGIYFKEMQDYEQAKYWFEKCSNRSVVAMSHLGFMHQNGIAGPVSAEDAFFWYHSAAEKGCATSMNNVGWCYQTGFGVAKSAQKAFKWYQRSAHADCLNAMGNVGRCYFTGEGLKGGKPDFEEAVFWFRKAADRGCDISMVYLAKCYEQGKGVKQSTTKAKFWTAMAVRTKKI
eukprot:TRINITY_DN59_c0_g1_i1.p1 TRINITY_DN59_c0_g1~~TRINITY_DN59_c0_g1_i1.p1  ORF type:complete len:559 (+),score=122.45 TRINITY_DN59_c0_g1_i1:6-1682(+)